jgi:hypothetical protein
MTHEMFKLPSAWVPLAMSGVALGLVLSQLVLSGTAREADEGAVAHLWQLLMVGQLPWIAWFLFRWFSKGWRSAAPVLTAQAVGLVLAAAPVLLLGL